LCFPEKPKALNRLPVEGFFAYLAAVANAFGDFGPPGANRGSHLPTCVTRSHAN
jgi:hypothetical protein